MDIQIERKKGLRILFAKRSLPYWGGMLFLLFAAWLLLRDNASTLRVDAGTLSVAEVTQGDFNDYIRVTGQVEPITTVQLSPLEAGVVERLVVEEGASVRRGDVLVELSNPSLTLEILNSEAELAEKQNLLRNTLISMEQEKLTLRQNKAQLDLDVARKRRAFEQNDELYAHRLIAREEWLQAKEDWELAEKQRELNIERQIQDSLYRTVQVEQMEDNLANMRRNMQLIRQRIGNLAVKSPIDGEIGLLDVVLGQSVASGQKIGQVNDLSDFKVEAQIDEIYIDRVRTGLEASFERQDSNYRMRLRKVYPEVRNNVFRADFNFTGAYPANIRSGQTYYLHLQLGQPTEAVLVPRGTFYQTTGGAWIYVLSPEGDRAYKRPIRIGRHTLIGADALILDNDMHYPRSGARWGSTLGQPEQGQPISIGEGCFIGARATILKGVTIGSGSVVAAGAVVTRDVPPGCLAIGNPAVNKPLPERLKHPRETQKAICP